MRGALRAAARARSACSAARGFSGSRAVAAQAAALTPDEVGAARARRFALLAGGGVLAAASYSLLSRPPPPPRDRHSGVEAQLSNWHARSGAARSPPSRRLTRRFARRRSNTHEVATQRYFEPESIAELEALVAAAHAKRQKLRPVGSGLSPNGLAFSSGGMVNLALCDKARPLARRAPRFAARALPRLATHASIHPQVLHVDAEKGRVTLQAGARLEVALAALKAHGWTLQNFSSIKEQQVGGWTQAGCHGTGASLPPVEETLVALKLVTPAKGTLVLDGVDNNPELFHLVKVGLGALGVVAEVTLQGVRAHSLAERTEVLTAAQVALKYILKMKEIMQSKFGMLFLKRVLQQALSQLA
jgi:FAD/FMN-containing dehydrogenase